MLNILQIINDSIDNGKNFKPESVKDIILYENKFLNNKDIEKVINDIYKKNLQSKDLIIYIDGNLDSSHAINTKGIIEKNLIYNNINNDYQLSYIPFNNNIPKNKKLVDDIIKNNYLENKNFDENYNQINDILKNSPNHIFILNEIIKQYKDKNKENKIYINESFSKQIDRDLIKLNKETPFEIFKNKDLMGKINEIKNENLEIINILNNNPNIFISKSAGNYHLYNNKELLENFQKITNNNFSIMQDMAFFLNQIIKYKMEDKELPKELEEFIKELKFLCKSKDIEYNDFINLYLIDYLTNFQGSDLVYNENKLINKNLAIVEAIDLDNIFNNYKNYIKYNNANEPLKESFTKYFENNNSINYNIEKIKEIELLYENNKKQYPEIFEISRYGSISLISYNDSNLLVKCVDGHNGPEILNGMVGTSISSPQYLTNKINKDSQKQIENNFNIER